MVGKGGGDHVSISITNRSAEGWLSGSLEVRAGAWNGSCGVWFHQGELRRLASEIDRLHEDLAGTVNFVPMEPYLELNFSGNGRGLIVVEGKAQDLLSQDTFLSFRLELDQTELPPIANALRTSDPA